MSRSTLRCALRAGALCLTATTVAALPAAADARVGVTTKRLNIQSGSRVTVTGAAAAPTTARLQIQRHGRWLTIDRDRTNHANRFMLRKRLRTTMSTRARVQL